VGLGAKRPRVGTVMIVPRRQTLRESDGDYDDVAADADIPEGTMKGVDVGDERVLLARVGGELCAISGLCTHQIAHLEDGVLDGRKVLCPRHGAAFDLDTGEPTPPADMPVAVYDVRVAGGRVYVCRTPRPITPRIMRPPCPGS
jgi:nitrite reductase/ring-hydroxylating ferredoxin subunit